MRPAATRERNDTVQTLGERLGDFAKYLPPPQTPRTPEQIERDRQADERRQAAAFRAHVENAIKALGRDAGPRLRDATLDNYVAKLPNQQEAIRCLRRYLEDCQYMESGLVLFGPKGTGKDHMAVAIAREIVSRHGWGVLQLNVQDWFSRLRDLIGDDRASERDEINRLTKPKLVILSEVLPLFGPLTPYQASMLYQLVESRTRTGVITFATLNAADDKEAGDRMGHPTWDRLCDNAGKLFCDWPSYRAPAWKVGC